MAATYESTQVATVLNRFMIQYNKQIQDQINLSKNTRNEFGVDTQGRVIGEQYEVTLKTGMPERGFGSRPHDVGNTGSLPTASAAEYVKAVITPKYHYYKFIVDLPTLDRSKGTGAVGPDQLKNALSDGSKLAAWHLNRMMFSPASGKIAQLFEAAASADQKVLKDPGVTWIRSKMYLDLYDATTQRINSIEVDSTSEGATYDTITLASSQTSTMAADAFFYLEDVYNASADNEMLGLEEFVDDSSALHGVSQSTYPKWKGSVYENTPAGTGRDFRIMLLKTSLSKTNKKSPEGKKVDLLISNTGQSDNYYEIIAPQQRWDGGKMKADYGLTELSFMATRWIIDEYCNPKRIWLINKDSIKQVNLREFAIQSDDGQTVRMYEDTDAVWGRMAGYLEMLCVCRNANGVIKDLNEPA